MTHEEGAEQVAQDVLGIVDTAVQIGELVSVRRLLAEQFREVERERDEAWRDVLDKANAEMHRVLCEVVSAGEALIPDVKESIQEAVTEKSRERLRALLAAWDAATKGIER